jgi:hypothetical protein
MKTASIPALNCLALAACLLGGAPAEADTALLNSSGKITLLRVHDVGTAYGPPSDRLDVEVVVTLSTQPGKAFGFQLRNDTNSLAHQGMLNLLRDAFNNNWTASMDYFIDAGKVNGRIIRVWVTR